MVAVYGFLVLGDIWLLVVRLLLLLLLLLFYVILVVVVVVFVCLPLLFFFFAPFLRLKSVVGWFVCSNEFQEAYKDER